MYRFVRFPHLPGSLSVVAIGLLLAVLELAFTAQCQSPDTAPPAHFSATALGTLASTTVSAQLTLAPPAFRIRSYLGVQHAQNIVGNPSGQCLDYRVLTTSLAFALPSVFLNTCGAANPIVVQELNNGRHDVVLHAGNFILGVRRPVAATAALAIPTADVALQLFSPAALLTGDVDYVFALDGDSIILASSRCAACSPVPAQRVVKLQRGRSNTGTPLVVGPRHLDDSEFFDFVATDGSDVDPTSGFIRVTDRDTLLIAMYRVNQVAVNNGAAWGSVIRIMNTGEPIDMSLNPAWVDPGGGINNIHNLVVPTGATIRGDRRATKPGPLLLGLYDEQDPQPGTRLFQVDGDYARITGLRLQGPSGSEDIWPDTIGILIGDPLLVHQPLQTIIDRNEIYYWPTDAVMPIGDSNDQDCIQQHPGTITGGGAFFIPGRVGSLDAALIQRNFIHDNQESGYGYGVSVSYGGGATILGNVFSYNRHAITSDDHTTDQYSAWDNLVLSQRPVYCGSIICKPQQDFDVHGTLSTGGQHDGGFAGYHADFGWNTLIDGGNPNLALRGQPCKQPDSFHNNSSGDDLDDAFKTWNYFGNDDEPTSSTDELTILNNTWKAPDPTNVLGVGDFDGDGVADLFLATGTTWFYSAGATTEWRYLNGGKTDHIQNLLLGDFNGDGRTDLVGINGVNLMVSWGGVSDWEILNSLPGASLSDMAAGDFDGDGRADILFADGVNWYLSSGGSAPFRFVNTSSFRINNLRFGHFQTCGSGRETDVFGIVSGRWQVTCGALNDWIPLPVSLTSNLTNLYVSDFDGDGYADIAVADKPDVTGGRQVTRWPWHFSHNGIQAFTTNIVSPTASCPDLNNSPAKPLVAGIGRFGGNPSSDILMWGTNRLCIVPAGVDEAQSQSRGLMR